LLFNRSGFAGSSQPRIETASIVREKLPHQFKHKRFAFAVRHVAGVLHDLEPRPAGDLVRYREWPNPSR
jgi:hypothetical protein